jgi:hypothetical protein
MGRVVKSTSRESTAASCVYLACRMAGYPRTVDEVSHFTGVAARDIGRLQLAISKGLGLSIEDTGRVTPESIVNRIASIAILPLPYCPNSSSQNSNNNNNNLHNLLVLYAKEMCRRISDNSILEQLSPQSLAAVSLVFVSLLLRCPISVQKLSEAALLLPSSVSSVYSKLHPFVVVSDGAVLVPEQLRHSFGKISAIPLKLERAMQCGKKKDPQGLLMTTVIPIPTVPIEATTNSELLSTTTNELIKKCDEGPYVTPPSSSECIDNPEGTTELKHFEQQQDIIDNDNDQNNFDIICQLDSVLGGKKNKKTSKRKRIVEN